MKKVQSFITVSLIVLMVLSCLRIDNTSNIFSFSTDSFVAIDASNMVDLETLDVNRGCSRIEQQDYLNVGNSTVLSSSLFRRSQSVFRNYERHEVSIAVLDMVSKVVMLAIVMILVAAGGTGLSMPFRCLLYYIQDMDGKKRIA